MRDRVEWSTVLRPCLFVEELSASSSNFAKFGLESNSDSDSEPKSSGGLSKNIKNYAKMREIAPSRNADGAAMGRKPPAGIAMVMLVPIALLM